MKRTTIKQMKDTGWYEFVRWAIKEGISPLEINSHTLTCWYSHKIKLSLAAKIEKDMFSYSDSNFHMVGLSKQVKNE